MKHTPVFAALLALLGTAAAHAAPFSLTNTTARAAAAQVADRFGVSIVYKSNVDFLPPVSLTVDDADAPGARLQAVNALANATQSDFTKTFVVGKLAGGDAVPELRVDSTAPITFSSTTVDAAEAIRTVAAVDSASAQISPDVSGTVTFTATQLTASEAAKQIAAQTRTRWKTFYALSPRAQGRVTGGRVIGYTASGSPITESPYVYYAHLPTPAEIAAQERADAAAARQQAQIDAQQQKTAAAYNSNYPQAAPNAAANPNGGYNPYSDPYGGYNPSVNPYANPYANPYGGFGNSYGGYGGFDTGSGLDVSNSYSGPIIFGSGF